MDEEIIPSKTHKENIISSSELEEADSN